MRILDVSSALESVLRRRAWDEMNLPASLLDGIEQIFGEQLTPEEVVRRILGEVRTDGDAALVRWAERLDRVTPVSLSASADQIGAAYEQVDEEVVAALHKAAGRIEAFHRLQPAISWIHNDAEGTLGQLVRPIGRVGVYAPGGTAPLPSSVLMTAIPAKVAGVPFIAVISPPQRATGLPHPTILVAADIVGVDAVYVSGGAQAIGALTFGTESVQAVDKICGPGNLFTTLAKRQVYGIVGIDGLPGPTETVVVADESADPQYAAADLLAQAEHDVLASAILLTHSRAMAEQVQSAVLKQLEELDRADVIVASMENGSGIVVTESLEQSLALANDFAPEHLCLLVEDPWQHIGSIQNAGGIFIGERSFEVLGDYVAGPSHVMPTGGTARFASPINVNDFVKIISLIGLNDRALADIGPAAERLARAEGLTAHAEAVRRRLEA